MKRLALAALDTGCVPSETHSRSLPVPQAISLPESRMKPLALAPASDSERTLLSQPAASVRGTEPTHGVRKRAFR